MLLKILSKNPHLKIAHNQTMKIKISLRIEEAYLSYFNKNQAMLVQIKLRMILIIFKTN